MPRLLALILSAAAVTACMMPRDAPGPAATDSEATMMRVQGSLNYDQSVALPVDAVASIAVYEYGLAYAVTEPVSAKTFALNGRQVPIPFEISLSPAAGTRSDTLEVVVRVSDGAGELIWVSKDDQTFRPRAGVSEIGIVPLLPAGVDIVKTEDLTRHDWMAAVINGQPLSSPTQITLRFEGDGRISGNAPCNAYTGSYTLEEGELAVGPLALTRKACPPPVMAQEQAFISVLEAASLIRINDEGVLVLEDGEGGSIVAR